MANRPLTVGYVVDTKLDHNSNVTSPNLPFDQPGTPQETIDDTVGVRKFVFVKNVGAAAIADGDCLVFLNNSSTQVGAYSDAIAAGFTIGASLNRAAGVGIGPISAGNYGWIQVSGYHPAVKTNGACANGQMLTLDNTSSTKVAAVALGTAASYTVVGIAVGAAASGVTPVNLALG